MRKILAEEVINSNLSNIKTQWGSVSTDSEMTMALMSSLTKYDCLHESHNEHTAHVAHDALPINL